MNARSELRFVRPVAALTAALAALSAGRFYSPAQAQDSVAAAVAAPASGAANINITPRRIVFERNKRTEAVYVFNQGTVAVTVDVALVDNVMLPSGEIVPVAHAGEKGPDAAASLAAMKSAKPFVLAAPSRLTLPPGQGRTIRVRALPPAAPQAAEYRTHLTVTTVPSQDTGITAEQAATAQSGELSFRIQSIFGISIPLIVRDGDVSAQAALGPMALAQEAGKPVLLVPLLRQGSGSLYGNIDVRAANKEAVGMVRGIGVYSEIGQRIAHLPLTRALRRGETVTVRYLADDGKPDSALASGTFTAP